MSRAACDNALPSYNHTVYPACSTSRRVIFTLVLFFSKVLSQCVASYHLKTNPWWSLCTFPYAIPLPKLIMDVNPTPPGNIGHLPQSQKRKWEANFLWLEQWLRLFCHGNHTKQAWQAAEQNPHRRKLFEHLITIINHPNALIRTKLSTSGLFGTGLGGCWAVNTWCWQRPLCRWALHDEKQFTWKTHQYRRLGPFYEMKTD